MKIKDCILIEAFTCEEQEGIIDVAKKLREIDLRHIFVVDEKGYPVGIISMTDINNRVVAEGLNPQTVKAKDVMTFPIEVFKLEDDINESCEKMISKGVLFEPVVNEDGKMIGIISLNELIKHYVKNAKE